MQRYKGPWADIQIWTEDPDQARDPGSFPFVEVYGPQMRFHLGKQNGKRVTTVGPYSIVQAITAAQGTIYKTLAKAWFSDGHGAGQVGRAAR